METAYLAGARRPPRDGRDARAANPEADIDLERLIYDPAYRQQVRDQLNQGKAAPNPDKDK